MNKQIRLLIIVLFSVTAVLAGAVIYGSTGIDSETSGNTAGTDESQPDIKSLGTEINAHRIFMHPSDKYGVINNGGKTVIDPIYSGLSFLGTECLIALDGSGNYGIINLSGDTVMPFVFSSCEKAGNNACICRTGKDFIIVNENGIPYMNEEWESVNFTDGLFTLRKSNGEYRARINGENALEIVSLVLVESFAGHSFTFSLTYEDENSVPDFKTLRKLSEKSADTVTKMFAGDIAAIGYYKSSNPDISLGAYELTEAVSAAAYTSRDSKGVCSYIFEFKGKAALKDSPEPANSDLNTDIDILVTMLKNANGELIMDSIELGSIEI
ncbi:MAG: hypothetical protein LBR54_00150 [Oscillospiraceae bacterium]|jgi:hypothetical protein|nr:hypothetical protein [Oscillospiraceae bacterium]